MLPSACGLGQARGHSFSLYGLTLSRQITYLFFPAVPWFTSGFVDASLSLNWLTTHHLQIIVKNLTSEQASNSDTRQRKMYLRTNLFRTTLC